ncbi:MAG: hypothetical protein JWM16_5343, partial [Verrucomicrobiales bacterium]|nr:hypothetical protein [Verrucomicrobiales bacterium]
NVGAGQGMTIETWINPSDIQTWHPLVEWNNASGSSTGEGTHFWLSSSTSSGILPGALYANLMDANFEQAHLIGTPGGIIQSGVWQHVALTYDKASGIARIYRNGAVVAQQSLGSFSPRTGLGYDLYLGFRATPGFPIRYAGLMDETAIYGRALGSSEIAAIFNAGSSGKCPGTTPPPSCVPAAVGLVSSWKGEGSALDSVDGNHGVIAGTMAYASAKVGQGFSYSGTANYVRVPASSNLNVGLGGGFTLEGWINPSSAPSQMPIFEWGTVNGNVGLQFWTSSYGTANLFANLVDAQGADHLFYSANNVLVSQQFQHVALTYDKASGLAAIYRNGVKVAETNFGSGLVARTTSDLYLGKRLGGQSFNGLLDELSVYRRSLTATEIAGIYSAGSFGKCTPQGFGPLITQQPSNVTVTEGQTAVFVAQATGSSPLNYQWKFGGSNLLGATSSSLVLSNVQLSQAGAYNVFVANPYGSSLSSNAVLSVAPISAPCVPASAGLVGWWKAEDNTLDSAGANNGMPVGTVAYTVGKAGRGFTYGSASGYVQVPGNPSLDVGQAGGFTLEGWINPSSAPTQMPIFEWGTPGSGVGLQFWTSSYGTANLFANIVDAGGVDHLLYSSNNVLVSQQFQHVAVTFDKATGVARIYRNGIKVAEANFGPGLVARTASELYLGKRIGGQTFSGVLDELSVYNRALQSGEVASIYTAGNGGKCALPPSPPAITQQPVSISVTEGAIASFAVGVSGSQPMTFQWRFQGDNLAGANQNSLTLSNVAASQAGPYDVVIANNYGSVTSVVANLSIDRLRILEIGAVPAQQEGTTITLPLNLISTGDVAGIDFKLTYNTNYLRAPVLEWDKTVKRAFTDLNTNIPGEVRGALVLAGETVPSGVQTIAHLSFFLRSVPTNLVTAVGLQILDMSGEAGDTLGGTLARGTNVTILVRSIIGDNNANNRLDVGDATAILRYLTGLEQTRPWDITLNNLNANTSLDSGDAIKVLRAASRIDPQPFGNNFAKSLSSVSGNATLYPAAIKSQPGQLVTVEVRMQNVTYPVAGASFSLNYDTNALRLVDSSSYDFGALVPSGALALWNIAPNQNNFGTQSGLASMAASTAQAWSSSNGTLAQLTFQVQPGANNQYQWPITLTSVEATEDGYINHSLATAGATLSVRAPVAARLAPSAALVNGKFSLTINGDTGVSYLVEASTDLVNWTPIATVVPANGAAVVTDDDSGNLPKRFYRVRLNQ